MVRVLTQSHAFDVDVPVFACPTCRVGTQPHVRPLQFMPTPVQVKHLNSCCVNGVLS